MNESQRTNVLDQIGIATDANPVMALLSITANHDTDEARRRDARWVWRWLKGYQAEDTADAIWPNVEGAARRLGLFDVAFGECELAL